MNENYLQFLWKVKRLPFHQIKTTSNQIVEILHVGTHNLNESGPDFLNGKIRINGIEWCGNIEVHIKSSDWYKHNHQLDPAYSNVILHVVYEHDTEIMMSGEQLPTIELKNHIDQEHFERWNNFASWSNEINCRKSLPEIEAIYLESMMQRAITDRLKRKVFFIQQDHGHLEEGEMLYYLVARAFGAKVNQLPFEELAARLPLKILQMFKPKDKQRLIEYTSGLVSSTADLQQSKVWVQANRHYKIGNVSSQSWKRKGMHAASRPEKRIAQFILFVQKFDFNVQFLYQSTDEIIQTFHKLIGISDQRNELKFSKGLIDTLIINCIVPFLWWMSEKDENDSFQEKALELLNVLPAENNSITRKWMQLGIKLKSAYESQALIEIYNEHCSKNKCLSCEIGVKVLNR